MTPTRVLVTGGVRSGKSTHAESLLAAEPGVTYVAPGPSWDDADWQVRIAAHRARRPATWSTVETAEVAAAVAAAPGAVIVDCLGTWLTRVLDDAGSEGSGWELPAAALTGLVRPRVQALAAAVAAAVGPVVLVTNEVGLGVVPAHRSGRVFRDLLGEVNQTAARACDEVHLVVAGRVLRL